MVRYLNAQGGGRVARIEGKIAWIEDPDGFELPTPLNECVVVAEKDTFVPAYTPPQKESISSELKPSIENESEKQREFITPPMPHLLMPERADGDNLSIYMAWVMVTPTQPAISPIECYLINDSNYTLSFQLVAEEGSGMCKIIFEGELERDTKLFIEEIKPQNLHQRETLYLQYIPFKREKSFALKDARTIKVHYDVLRLLKKHAYVDNDFFDEGAIVIPIIERDVLASKTVLPTKELESLINNTASEKNATSPVHARKSKAKNKRKKEDKPIEIDLHAHLLVTHPEEYSPGDLLAIQMTEFRKVMDEIKHNKGTKAVFIHGKGEGVLRKAILDELKRHYPKASAQDASFKEYGFGATQVTIH